MPIPFTCPHCGHQTNVADQYAGQSGPCASCGKTVTVPPAPGDHRAHGAPRKSSGGAGVGIAVAAVLVLFLACGGILAYLMLPAMTTRKYVWEVECRNNLKQIGLVMHSYHDTYKCFPPAVITDEKGQPMRSWRVAILPFMERAPLYGVYDFSEPWDGPSNLSLHAVELPEYQCPGDAGLAPWDTSYVMVVGEGTLGGEANEAVSVADVADGTANTILAIEVAASGIHWMEPRDMTVDEAVAYITAPTADGQEHVHPQGVNVLFADGSVRSLDASIDPQTLRSLLTRDDGQALPEF